MSDIAIKIEGVTKSFRRFRHPGWRALDAFGVSVPRSRYDIFDALRGIDIEVRQGERTALIGRNGAGKSTLVSTRLNTRLKIFSRSRSPQRHATCVNYRFAVCLAIIESDARMAQENQ